MKWPQCLTLNIELVKTLIFNRLVFMFIILYVFLFFAPTTLIYLYKEIFISVKQQIGLFLPHNFGTLQNLYI